MRGCADDARIIRLILAAKPPLNAIRNSFLLANAPCINAWLAFAVKCKWALILQLLVLHKANLSQAF
jgi:hypothetical protein